MRAMATPDLRCSASPSICVDLSMGRRFRALLVLCCGLPRELRLCACVCRGGCFCFGFLGVAGSHCSLCRPVYGYHTDREMYAALCTFDAHITQIAWFWPAISTLARGRRSEHA